MTIVRYTFVGAALMTASHCLSAQVARNPYLQAISDTSVTIRWDTRSPSTGRVTYSATNGMSWQDVTSDVPSNRHSVRLGGLQSSSTYLYKVFVDGSPLLSGDSVRFMTLPSSDDTSFSFFLFGDSGDSSRAQRRIRDRLKQRLATGSYSFGLHLGDMVYPYSSYEGFTNRYFWMYDSILRTHCVFTTPGNHEYYGDEVYVYHNAVEYFASFSSPATGAADGSYYSFDAGNAHFISLNIAEDSTFPGYPNYAPGTEQYAWLRNELFRQSVQDKQWRIVFFHKSPFTRARSFTQTEYVRQYLVPLFEQFNVELVLTGHSHLYEAGEREGVTYIVSGGGGQLNLGDSIYVVPEIHTHVRTHHFCTVHIDGASLTITAIDSTGAIFDTVSVQSRRHERLVKRDTIPERLLQATHAFPNPFSGSVTVEFYLDTSSTVTVGVYNVLGQCIRTSTTRFERGSRWWSWDGRNAKAAEVDSGVYIIRVETDRGERTVKKIVKVR